jgi:hypothetical protein
MKTLRKQKIAAVVFFLGLIAATAILSFPAINAQTSTPGLISYWKFDEGSGTTASDSSGNSNTASISGSTWVAGKSGTALNFDGAKNFLSVPDSASLTISKTLTLEAWVNVKAASCDKRIICKPFSTTKWAYASYELCIIGDSGSYGSANLYGADAVFFSLEFETGMQYVWTSVPVDSGAWTHLAATYDGTSMRIYVNGVQEAVKYLDPANQSLKPASNPLVIGCMTNNLNMVQSWNTPFEGLIDEVSIWNYALSADAIAQQFNGSTLTQQKTASPTTTASNSPSSVQPTQSTSISTPTYSASSSSNPTASPIGSTTINDSQLGSYAIVLALVVGVIVSITAVFLRRKGWSGKNPEIKTKKGIIKEPEFVSVIENDSGKSRKWPFDVFISYSQRDKNVADALCSTLERRKIRCWIAPRDILAGTDFAAALIQALNNSSLLVLVFSKESNASPHVMREVQAAVSRGIPIIPFRIEDVKPTEAMEYYLGTPHWLDALTPPLEKHMQELANTVQLLLNDRRIRPN